MALNLRRGIFLLFIPFVFYASFIMIKGALSAQGVMVFAEMITPIYYFVYLFYVSILPDYNCMSVVRFDSSAKMLWYFYKRTLFYAFSYVIYMTAVYEILAAICNYNFAIQNAFQFTLFNLIAVLILNFICTVIGIKFNKDILKPFAFAYILIMDGLVWLLSEFSNTLGHLALLISIFHIYCLNKFTITDVITIVLIYCLNIGAGVGIYFLANSDTL